DLVGEPEPLRVEVGEYVLSDEGGRTWIEVRGVRTSKPWLDILAAEILKGRRFEVPGAVRAVLLCADGRASPALPQDAHGSGWGHGATPGSRRVSSLRGRDRPRLPRREAPPGTRRPRASAAAARGEVSAMGRGGRRRLRTGRRRG